MNDGTAHSRYDREALDREYDNRRKVADSATHIAWYARASADWRARHGGVLDLAYGPSAAETLDIFGAGTRGESRPVHVFFHGGYWRAMHKDDFSYVAGALQPAGVVTVVVNYALVPAVDLATLVAQCRRALLFVHRHIGEHGGDPGRILVSGHSAGGHLVGMMLATDWPALDPSCPPSLMHGGLAISGLFDLEPIRHCFLNDDLRLDPAAVRANSPLVLDKHDPGPLLAVYGGEEGDEYRRQSESLASAWPNTRARALDGLDHFSIMREFDRPEGAVARIARAMIDGAGGADR